MRTLARGLPVLSSQTVAAGGVSGAWTPKNIPGLSLWLKSDAGLYQDAAKSAPAVADADPVGCWADQSGNGRDATQSAAGARPLLKLNVLNGKPTVRFDATDDGLTSGLTIDVAPYTIYAVFCSNTLNPSFKRAINGTDNWLIGPYGPYISHFAGGWVSENALQYTEYTFYITDATNDGAASHFYINGADVTQNTTPVRTPLTVGLGAAGSIAEPLNGDIAEVLAYNSVLATANRQAIERYLATRYGITLAS